MQHSEIHYIDDDTVRKVLASELPIYKKRFLQEIDILKKLKEVPTIVDLKISGINANSKPYYDMLRFKNNANSLLGQTKGDVLLVVLLILPIVKTLKLLSEMTFPIYHKDLKPENLLVTWEGELRLADFGCAIMHEDGNNRITSNMRMIGERSFLAPEYAENKTEELSEKADVFSIGKLLWYFVNGNEKELFPQGLSCDEFYDITKRFPQVQYIQQLQQIIKLTTSHKPEHRIGYVQLISLLEGLA